MKLSNPTPFRHILLRAAPALLAAAVASACSGGSQDFFPGYAEADYVRLSSPIGGSLARLHVKRGDTIRAGAPVFVLEQENEAAARREARAQVARAQAVLDDALKAKRPPEIEAVREQLAQARAAERLSAADLARTERLVAQKFVAASQLDAARAAHARDDAHVKELQAQVKVARLPARSDAIRAAEQDLNAAKEQLAQMDWKLEQKTQNSPADAEVFDVLYREGEWVAAGSPVVSLLPPQNIKARFFVPEKQLGALRIGQQVELRCDGCGAAVAAAVSFIAPQAEYTSPLIYSRENRANLVFMIEARPAAADVRKLHPGQPLEVHLGAQPAAR